MSLGAEDGSSDILVTEIVLVLFLVSFRQGILVLCSLSSENHFIYCFSFSYLTPITSVLVSISY